MTIFGLRNRSAFCGRNTKTSKRCEPSARNVNAPVSIFTPDLRPDSSSQLRPELPNLLLGEQVRCSHGVRILGRHLAIPLKPRQRSRENRLRSLFVLDERLQHPDRTHDTRRPALLPRRHVHQERKHRLQELRRMARLVFQILSYSYFLEEEY